MSEKLKLVQLSASSGRVEVLSRIDNLYFSLYFCLRFQSCLTGVNNDFIPFLRYCSNFHCFPAYVLKIMSSYPFHYYKILHRWREANAVDLPKLVHISNWAESAASTLFAHFWPKFFLLARTQLPWSPLLQ